MDNYITKYDHIVKLSDQEISVRIKKAGIYIGQYFKNRKILFETLNIAVLKGKGQKRQEEVLQRFLKWEQVEGKQAVIIVDVFDVPLASPYKSKGGRPKRIKNTQKKPQYRKLLVYGGLNLLFDSFPNMNNIQHFNTAIFRKPFCAGLGILPYDFYKATRNLKKRDQYIRDIFTEDYIITNEDIAAICSCIDNVSRNYFRSFLKGLNSYGIGEYDKVLVCGKGGYNWEKATEEMIKKNNAMRTKASVSTGWRSNQADFSLPQLFENQNKYDTYQEKLEEMYGETKLYNIWELSINLNNARTFYLDNVDLCDTWEKSLKESFTGSVLTGIRAMWKNQKTGTFSSDGIGNPKDYLLTDNIENSAIKILNHWNLTRYIENIDCHPLKKPRHLFFNKVSKPP